MFGCARVAGWSAHILEQKRLAPPPCARRRATSARRLAPSRIFLTALADAAGEADALAEEGKERELVALRATWDDDRGVCAHGPTSASAPSPTAQSGSSVFAPRRSCCVAGSRTTARRFAAPRCYRSSGCRGTTPATSTMSARSCTSSIRERRQRELWRRLAVVALRTALRGPTRSRSSRTIGEDDEQSASCGDAAAKVAQALRRKGTK